jgi:hypothetical protein
LKEADNLEKYLIKRYQSSVWDTELYLSTIDDRFKRSEETMDKLLLLLREARVELEQVRQDLEESSTPAGNRDGTGTNDDKTNEDTKRHADREK